MKSIVAAVVALCLVAAAAYASVPLTVKTDDASLIKFAEKQGCKPLVFFHNTGVQPNGQFYTVNDKPRIRLITVVDQSEQDKLIVFYHELGHCMQWVEQDPNMGLYPYIELDADQRAADMACKLGMNGPQMTREWFKWLYEHYGYTGDVMHGSVEERIHAAETAPACVALDFK